MTKILGIDPALATIGYGLIQDRQALDYGVIKTRKDDLTSDRLNTIYQDIQEVVCTLKPDVVGLEMPFFNAKITNAVVVQHAVGVIRLALRSTGHPDPIFLHQSQVKAAVCRGGASKREVKEAVCSIFSLHPDKVKCPDDAIDGLAIAYAASIGISANVNHAPETEASVQRKLSKIKERVKTND